MGRDKDCCSTPYNVQGGRHNKEPSSPNVHSAEVETWPYGLGKNFLSFLLPDIGVLSSSWLMPFSLDFPSFHSSSEAEEIY